MKRLEISINLNNPVTDGFLIVDKPKGMTSNDLCQILKKRYNIKSCGHVGTLDPDATGLNILAFGKATKLLNLLDTDIKTYITTIKFGYETDTLDDSGKIIEETDELNLDKLDIALEELKNQDTQIPPMVSAIKVNGKKLYEYKLEGKDVDIKERNVKLLEYKILKDIYRKDGYYYIDLILKVSKGYYIRSFARDLAYKLDSLGVVKELRRIEVGSYKINDSYPLDTLLNQEIDIIPITNFIKCDKIEIDEKILNFVLNGVTLYPRNLINNSDCKNYKQLARFFIYYEGKPISLYEKKEEGIYRPLFKF